VLRDRLRQQVHNNTAAKTNVTLGYLLDEWLTGHQVEETTRASYRLLIDSFIRPALGDTPIARLCRLGPRPFEQLYGRRPGLGPGRGVGGWCRWPWSR
jgi:integrase